MRVVYTILLLLLTNACFAQNEVFLQNDSIESRIVLIGDAGDPGSLVNGKAVVIDAARKTVPMDKKTTVLFLGDNIYVNGLPCEGDACYAGAIDILDSQVALVKGTEAMGYFLPGNHDWANGKPEGYDNIIRQGSYLNHIADNVKFYPEDGCPGPVEIPIGKDAVLVIMDSEWWLLRGEKPGIESDCAFKTEEEVLEEIKDIISHNPNKLIIFACHHPFKSTGVHSGYFGLKQHIFPFTELKKNLYIPLPLLGSIYPISRSVFGSPQDMKYPLYANMINRVENVLKANPYVVHVAGHEHNLQLIDDSNYHYIVSGGGCKSQRVARSRKTKYVSGSRGFAVMDISKNKNVRVTFFELDAKTNEVKQAYTQNILNFSKFPELAKDTITVHETVYQDSAVAAANTEYAKASAFKRLLLGDNYRAEWATPVKLKVFNMKKEHGGFKIDRLGGGNQTKSLHLKDTAGVTWVLRNLNKDPEKVIPANFRHTFASSIVQDMISAANPYGALPVPVLSDALGVVHSTPQYFFVPDDYNLGIYRTLFANNICMLERADPTINGEKSKSTMKLFNKLRDKDNRKVDQKSLLKARMLDFLIADYDRHQDQWKWGILDSGKAKVYYPIPTDRDQAFFNSRGLIMRYVTWRRLPFLTGFQHEVKRIKWQGFVARYFDRQYLNEINEDEWKLTMAEFHKELSDSVISESVKRLPPEIARMDSAMMVDKLKNRRNNLAEKSLIYYRFLARRVNILGSNNDEYFHIKENAGKGLSVDVYNREDNGDTGMIMYSRTFEPGLTKEIRLYGFNGNDYFKIDDNVRSKIRVIMVGGQGSDTFSIHGKVPNAIYDFTKEQNTIVARNKTRNMLSSNPLVNNYDAREDNYTVWRYPHLEMGFNQEDGFLLGAGIFVRTFNFRKKPYSSDQKLTSLFAMGKDAYQVRYNGVFRDVVRKTDIVLEGKYINPTLNNFFGFGNDTKKTPGADIQYYRVRYTDLDGSLLIRKRYFNEKLSVGVGPAYYYYANSQANQVHRILEHPGYLGLDSASIYKPKSYAGGKLAINVYNLNGDMFPTRGVDWTTTFSAMSGLNPNSQSISKFESDMAVYASLTDPARVVAVLHLGGGHIFSKNYEFFQALTLGANNHLRGFRKDRFAGSSLLYGSLELRVKLLDVNSYIVPGTLGLVGFNDIGRVWVKNENSGTWHNAYGGGLYYTPFNMVILSVTTALSGEESLVNFAVGTKINLIF